LLIKLATDSFYRSTRARPTAKQHAYVGGTSVIKIGDVFPNSNIVWSTQKKPTYALNTATINGRDFPSWGIIFFQPVDSYIVKMFYRVIARAHGPNVNQSNRIFCNSLNSTKIGFKHFNYS